MQIDYLGEQRNAWIGSKIDKGLPVAAEIDRFLGIRRGQIPGRVTVRILVDGVRPAAAVGNGPDRDRIAPVFEFVKMRVAQKKLRNLREMDIS